MKNENVSVRGFEMYLTYTSTNEQITMPSIFEVMCDDLGFEINTTNKKMLFDIGKKYINKTFNSFKDGAITFNSYVLESVGNVYLK